MQIQHKCRKYKSLSLFMCTEITLGTSPSSPLLISFISSGLRTSLFLSPPLQSGGRGRGGATASPNLAGAGVEWK